MKVTAPLVIEPGDWEARVKAEVVKPGNYKVEGGLLPLMMGKNWMLGRHPFPGTPILGVFLCSTSLHGTPLGGSTSLCGSSPGPGY